VRSIDNKDIKFMLMIIFAEYNLRRLGKKIANKDYTKKVFGFKINVKPQ